MDKKEKNQIINNAMNLIKNRRNIIEGKTAIETMNINIPTNKELTDMWQTAGTEGMFQWQIVKLYSLLDYFAKKIDDLESSIEN